MLEAPAMERRPSVGCGLCRRPGRALTRSFRAAASTTKPFFCAAGRCRACGNGAAWGKTGPSGAAATHDKPVHLHAAAAGGVPERPGVEKTGRQRAPLRNKTRFNLLAAGVAGQWLEGRPRKRPAPSGGRYARTRPFLAAGGRYFVLSP